MSKKNPSKCKNISIADFNKLLEDTKYLKPILIEHIGSLELIVNQMTYRVSLTGEVKDILDPGTIMLQLKKQCTLEDYIDIKDPERFGFTKRYFKTLNKTKTYWDLRDPGNFSYVKDQKKPKWLTCWSYDINSAYAYAMIQKMPDTRVEPKMYNIVGPNEIGFYRSGYATTEIGAYAEYIFPLIESPFKDYVNNYYSKKEKATDKKERFKWKSFLNIASGLLHKHNIFVRLAILYYAGDYISSFIDEDTVYCNTDSIVSTKPRTDIPLGTGLGQFKEEHQGEPFKYKDVGIYQWGNDCHYTGIPGCTLTDIENIDKWYDNFPYRFNRENWRIEENV